MILPIVGYGNSVLKKEAQEITKDYPDLAKLIEDMFETMYAANGVGLAAPQINLSIRLIVVDADPFKETYPEAEGFKQVFINPTILEYKGEMWSDFEEGCLSLPEIHEEVARPSEVVVRYFDENFARVDFSMDAAAKDLHISQSSMRRAFVMNLGVSPVRYLTGLRMKRAVELLVGSGLSIREISLECGYDDEKYFSRVFKKRYGYPPSAFSAN
jgi:peptide deformylase